jgi:flagellin-like protein
MKITKSRRALSPVVASIILIAVTVAVSIAVAAWMGALTLNFTKTENIVLPEVSAITWVNTTANSGTSIQMPIKNGASALVTITTVKVNGNSTITTTPSVSFSLQPNEAKTVAIDFNWIAGNKYRVDFITSNNNDFYQEYTAPSP